MFVGGPWRLPSRRFPSAMLDKEFRPPQLIASIRGCTSLAIHPIRYRKGTSDARQFLAQVRDDDTQSCLPTSRDTERASIASRGFGLRNMSMRAATRSSKRYASLTNLRSAADRTRPTRMKRAPTRHANSPSTVILSPITISGKDRWSGGRPHNILTLGLDGRVNQRTSHFASDEPVSSVATMIREYVYGIA